MTFLTFGDGGRFSSSENEGERGFRCRRVGLGVAGGEGEGVAGWDFPNDCSESSWSSSCSSEPESSLKESSSSRSSSSPLPYEPYTTTELYKILISMFCLKINWSGKCCRVIFFQVLGTCGDPTGVLSTEAEERLFLCTKSCFLLFLLLPLLFTPPSRLVCPPGGRPTRLLFFFP